MTGVTTPTGILLSCREGLVCSTAVCSVTLLGGRVLGGSVLGAGSGCVGAAGFVVDSGNTAAAVEDSRVIGVKLRMFSVIRSGCYESV